MVGRMRRHNVFPILNIVDDFLDDYNIAYVAVDLDRMQSFDWVSPTLRWKLTVEECCSGSHCLNFNRKIATPHFIQSI